MSVRNRETARIESTCTPEELAAALQAANLQAIEDPKVRFYAAVERVNQVMLATATAKGRLKAGYTLSLAARMARSGLLLPTDDGGNTP